MRIEIDHDLGTFFSDHAFGKASSLRVRAIWLPNNSPIRESADNHAVGCSAKSFNAIPDFPIRSFAKGLHNFNHSVLVQNTSDIVSDGRSCLTFANRPKIAEKRQSQFAADSCECITVEEEKRSPLVKMPQLVESLRERQRLVLEIFPAFRARDSSFRVKSMLCSTLARSLVDADDRLPVPVFEKLGSGL